MFLLEPIHLTEKQLQESSLHLIEKYFPEYSSSGK